MDWTELQKQVLLDLKAMVSESSYICADAYIQTLP